MTSEFERVVFIDLKDEKKPVPAGLFTLDPDLGVGKFQYGRRYLERPNAIALDPVNLPLTEEEYLTRKNKGMFGVLADVLPDSWGRFVLAKQHNVPFGTLKDHELLDMASTQTTGALFFGKTPDHPNTPHEKTVHLDDLDEIARAFDRAMEEGPLPPEILFLLRQGTSLGGAQPKCPVSIDGNEWIAKFESSKTLIKYPAIEYATMLLARKAGIHTPDIRLETVAGRRVYLIKRFDRAESRRIPFLSALAVSNLDIDELEQGSYIEIAARMRKFCKNVRRDLQELYRRIVFNMCVRNEDDHLRNHGFIFIDSWELSPAYDIVPMPVRQKALAGFYLSLLVGDHGSEATLANLLSSHEQFSLTRKEALEIIHHIMSTITHWETTLKSAGVDAGDLESVRWCFEGFRTREHPHLLEAMQDSAFS